MVTDPYKGATYTYNLLGMPSTASILAVNGTINYKYDAAGNKQEVNYAWHNGLSLDPLENIGKNYAGTNSSKTVQYAENKIYEDGALTRILLPNGYISGGIYYFYIQDHLGNNAVVVHQNGLAVMQRTYYHPFGKPIGNGESTGEALQPYKYGGKEQQTMLGLTQYDFSARTLDYSYNRFMSVDPLAEKYYNISPYAYCANNPINNIDPTGMDWVRKVDGEIVWRGDVTRENYESMLSSGETYMGDSHYVRDKNGNLVEEYRSDGTIIYHSNEQIGLLDIFNLDYNGDGKSSWWEFGIDGVLYAGDLLLGGPTGESLVAKGALMGITKGAGKVLGKGIGKNAQKMSIEEIGKFLKAGDNWHKTKAKSKFLKKFEKELKGDTNADFFIDKNTKEVFLKSNKSGNWINTGQKLK